MIDVIKKMARAISAEGGFKSETYPETLAQAAYTAMMQHLAEAGQVIVPEDPSEGMIWHGASAFDHPSLYMGGPSHTGKRKSEAIYRAMIAASAS